MAKLDVRDMVPPGCRVTKSALADAALAVALRELGAKGKRSRLVREFIRELARDPAAPSHDPTRTRRARRDP
jgi:hypothetical protein